MVEVKVNPGVCGLNSIINIESEDMQNVELHIQSDCPYIQKMAEELKELDGFNECFAKVGDGQVYQAANKHCKHAACPVPAAIIKGIEVACELALPRNVEISISK
ncbi:MAG: hypothetical protein AB7G87_10230 [Clostridia bacterium]